MNISHHINCKYRRLAQLLNLIKHPANCDQRKLQNTPLFLKKGEGLGEGKNLFSREKKFFSSLSEPFHFDRIACRNCDNRHIGGDAAAGIAAGPQPC